MLIVGYASSHCGPPAAGRPHVGSDYLFGALGPALLVAAPFLQTTSMDDGSTLFVDHHAHQRSRLLIRPLAAC